MIQNCDEDYLCWMFDKVIYKRINKIEFILQKKSQLYDYFGLSSYYSLISSKKLSTSG